jgi:hypothetical protein
MINLELHDHVEAVNKYRVSQNSVMLSVGVIPKRLADSLSKFRF